MQLPNLDKAIVAQAKVVEYLLAVDHPVGGGKAEFFLQFGFTATEWETLAGALLEQARTHAVTSSETTVFGTKYRIDGPLACPDGRLTRIRSVWIIDNGSDVPRLVTAHPIE